MQTGKEVREDGGEKHFQFAPNKYPRNQVLSFVPPSRYLRETKTLHVTE